MTTLLKITNFSELTTCLTIFFYLDMKYLNSLIFLFLLVYAPNILIYSKGFLNSLPSLSTKKKSAKNTDVGSSWLGNTFARDYSIKDASIKDIYITDIYIRKTSTGNTYIGSISVIFAYIKSISTKEISIENTNSIYNISQ